MSNNTPTAGASAAPAKQQFSDQAIFLAAAIENQQRKQNQTLLNQSEAFINTLAHAAHIERLWQEIEVLQQRNREFESRLLAIEKRL